MEELEQKVNELNEKCRRLELLHQRYVMEIKSLKKTIVKKDERINEIKSQWDPKVLERGGSDKYMHGQNLLESIINSDSMLKRTISKSKPEFDDICSRVAALSLEDNLLFYEDGKPLPGNRCRLSRDQSVYLAILSKKSNVKQIDLEVPYGIDQSTVSRTIEYIDSILVKVLPTAHAIQQEIKHAGVARLDKFVPDNELVFDGAEFPVVRPQDDEVQKLYYSGKKKRHTAKVSRHKQVRTDLLHRARSRRQDP